VSEDALIKFMKNPILYFQCEPITPITKICIIGPRYSGQTSITKLLAKQYNLQTIYMEQIIQCIDKSLSSKNNLDKDISMEDNLFQKVIKKFFLLILYIKLLRFNFEYIKYLLII